MSTFVVIAIGLTGVLILVAGLRGRRIDGHLHCRRCGYDLSGTGETPKVCSECGAALTGRRALRYAIRRRPRFILLGSLLLMLAAAGGGILVWAAASDFRWIEHKPVRWLMTDVQSLDSSMAYPARRELYSRFEDGRLSDRQIADAIAMALDVQGDHEAPWKGRLGALLDAAWAFDLLEPEGQRRYVRQMVDGTMFCTPRAIVRAGEPVPIRYGRTSPRDPTFSNFGTDLVPEVSGLTQVTGLAIDGEPVECSFRPQSFTIRPSLAGGWTTKRLSLDLLPGEHEMTFIVEVAMVTLRGGERMGNHQDVDDVPSPFVRWRSELTSTVTVVPADATAVELVPDPVLEETIASSTMVVLATRDTVELPKSRIHVGKGVVIFDDLPVDVAFEIIARRGDTEHRVGGAIGGAAGKRRGSQFDVDPHTLFPDAESIDIVLRADGRVAEETSDIMRIWDGEIVVEGVAMRGADSEFILWTPGMMTIEGSGGEKRRIGFGNRPSFERAVGEAPGLGFPARVVVEREGVEVFDEVISAEIDLSEVEFLFLAGDVVRVLPIDE